MRNVINEIFRDGGWMGFHRRKVKYRRSEIAENMCFIESKGEGEQQKGLCKRGGGSGGKGRWIKESGG